MDNIKNKFPELIHFIENPKSYELLYYREDTIHNEYALDVEEAKEIIKFIEDLEQQLKKKDEVIEKAIKVIKECKMLFPHEFDWGEQTDNLLQILEDKEVEQ